MAVHPKGAREEAPPRRAGRVRDPRSETDSLPPEAVTSELFFRQPIGDHRRELEQIFDAMTRAYDTPRVTGPPDEPLTGTRTSRETARALFEVGNGSEAGRFALRAPELAPDEPAPRELLLAFFQKMGMDQNAKRERGILKRILAARGA